MRTKELMSAEFAFGVGNGATGTDCGKNGFRHSLGLLEITKTDCGMSTGAKAEAIAESAVLAGAAAFLEPAPPAVTGSAVRTNARAITTFER